ncbi:S-adenosyl-L-methionine-dependent methyltransferase, partial [Fistulina hepatica ATCC 64428]
NDPYGLFHLELNRRGESTPQTEWLNMGFWKETDTFPEACEALAMRLIKAADLAPDSRILDVGHGTGESLVLLLRGQEDVPPISALAGITSLPAHHERAQHRIDNILSSWDPAERPPRVSLFVGDAVWRPSNADVVHPLGDTSGMVFDAILALDCAYHFRDRVTFLRQAYRHLDVNGRVALADIAFDSQLPLWAWWVAPVIPRENAVSVDVYRRQMQDIGYTDVHVNDISEFVFPGFVRFLKTRTIGWRIFGHLLELYVRYTKARFLIVDGLK